MANTVKRADMLDALQQAQSYSIYIANDQKVDEVIIAGIIYSKSHKSYEIDIFSGKRAANGQLKTCSSTTRTKRSISKFMCWEDVDTYENKEEIKEELQSKLERGLLIDTDEFADFIKYNEPDIKIIELVKELKNPHMSTDEIAQSPCAKKLPSRCFDKVSIELLGKIESKDIINDFKRDYPQVIVSNSVKWYDAVDISANIFMTFDIIHDLGQAIENKDYAAAAEIVGFQLLIFTEPYIVRLLEHSYEKYLTIQLIESSLGNLLPNSLKNKIVLSIYWHLKTNGFIPKSIIKVPFVAISVYATYTSVKDVIKQIKELEEANGYEKAHVVLGIVESSCDVVANFGNTILLITGQMYGQAGVAILALQLSCHAGTDAGHYFLKMSEISDDIELSAGEIINDMWNKFEEAVLLGFGNEIVSKNWVNPDEIESKLERDRIVHQIYKEIVLENTYLRYFNVVVTSLPEVKFVNNNNNLSETEIANSNFLNKKRFRINDDFGYFLKNPTNPIVKLVGSMEDESNFTRDPSRTLKKFADDENKIRKFILVCSPTASDVTQTTEGLWEIGNKDEENNSLNNCRSAIAVAKVENFANTDEEMKAFYNVPATNSSHVEMANIPGVACYYNYTKYITGFSKVTFILLNAFDPSTVDSNKATSFTMFLSGHNFTENSALSPVGHKTTTIISPSSSDTPIVIYAGRNTSQINFGVNTTVYTKLSISPNMELKAAGKSQIYMTNQTSARHIDLAILDSENFIGFVEMFLPSEEFPFEDEFNLNIFNLYMTNDSNELTLFDFYKFSFDRQNNVLSIAKNSSQIFCKIHTLRPIKSVNVNINGNLMLTIFFEANDDTESKEKAPQIIHVMLQNFLPKISDRYEALSTMTDYLYNHGSLNGIQQYTIEDSRFQIKYHTRMVTEDFAHNGDKELQLYLKAMKRNFVFIEHCIPVRIAIRDICPSCTKDLEYFLYVNTNSSNYGIDELDRNNLNITYTCSNGQASTITLVNYFDEFVQNHHIMLHMNNLFQGKIVRVNAITYSMESYGSKTVQKIAHLSTSFLNEDLDNVSIIFFPEVYSHADLIALRYNNSLILLHKPTQKIVFIENYKDAMDIELIFTNDHMILADLIQNGDNYIKYMNKQDKKNIHQMIDNEELRLIEIKENFEIHLDESINIQTIFIVRGDIENTSICRDEEDYQILLLNFEYGEIRIFNWDNENWETENHRPLFVFASHVLDIRHIALDESWEMELHLRKMKEDARNSIKDKNV
ncbi:hypothetical protein Ddc_13204 [Ditylenchus destructor]|nr:hypothetical protein Ddc_13204 [Ditylenchus destructor]